jgi:voltage-gated potassium channel
MYYRVKKSVYDTVVNEESKTLAHRIFYSFITILILFNIVLVAVSTIPDISTKYYIFIVGFDLFVIFVFTIEYALRIWSCNIDKRFAGRFGRLKYARQPIILVDLLAILPFYVVYFSPLDNRYAIIGRLLRLVRIFRFGFFSRAITVLRIAIKKKAKELLVTIIFISILVVFCAYLIYYSENRAQPEVFSSIPRSIYWAFVTLSTVGYGDMTPITPFGRFFTAIVSFLGVGIIAIPAGIISSGMVEILKKKKSAEENIDKKSSSIENNRCPHCGKKID